VEHSGIGPDTGDFQGPDGLPDAPRRVMRPRTAARCSREVRPARYRVRGPNLSSRIKVLPFFVVGRRLIGYVPDDGNREIKNRSECPQKGFATVCGPASSATRNRL